MNTSGILVIAAQRTLDDTVGRLKAIPGLVVHSRLPGGRLVVLLERESTREEADALREIQALDGVVTAAMVNHHFEDETAPA